MPAILYKHFNGEIPAKAPELIPDASAQFAKNCEFTDGHLKPLTGGVLLTSLSTNPTRGLYTEDGLSYFSWTQEVLTFKSPLLSDSFGRMYYLQPSSGVFSVATKNNMSTSGGPPPGVIQAGVPKPVSAPELSLTDRTSLPDYPSVTVSCTAWWDYAGQTYAQAAVALTGVTAFKKYTFTAPALPSSPPANVTPTLVAELVYSDNNNSGVRVMAVVSRAGSVGRSQALPGGVEMALKVDSTNLATIDLTWGIAETIAYTYTYSNVWGEEGAPAPPAVISRTYLHDVRAILDSTQVANMFLPYKTFLQFNLYRTYGANATYVRCSSGSIGTIPDASRAPTSLGVTLVSTDYYPPPTGLQGAVLMPGGWFAAFVDNKLYKSQPYAPHAWPYEEMFPKVIRGICPGAGGLVVTCADGVYLVPGTDPSAAGYSQLPAPQAGISQRSMAAVDGAVAYASHDGLVLVDGSQASIQASQRIFSRDDWRSIFSSILGDFSLRLAFHDGYVVGSSNTHPLGFLLRFDEDIGAFCRTDIAFDTTIQLPINDALYYTIGANVFQWKGGANLTYDWWGRNWIFARPAALGAGYINCVGPVTLTVYADDAAPFTKSFTAPGYFRLPARLARMWSVRLSGTGVVKELALAQSMVELQQVP